YDSLLQSKGEDAAIAMVFERSRRLSLVYRKLETSGKPWVAALNGTAMRGCRQSQDAARPARDQGRAVPRRRGHAAHRAHDGHRGRAPVPAQGRSDPV